MEVVSKIEQKHVCRKCKTAYLSVNGSSCPICSVRNLELAKKRRANREARKLQKDEKNVITPEETAGDGAVVAGESE